jgi:hypothetical protein
VAISVTLGCRDRTKAGCRKACARARSGAQRAEPFWWAATWTGCRTWARTRPLRAGGTTVFAADVQHAYEGAGRGACDVVMTVHLPLEHRVG